MATNDDCVLHFRSLALLLSYFSVLHFDICCWFIVNHVLSLMMIKMNRHPVLIRFRVVCYGIQFNNFKLTVSRISKCSIINKKNETKTLWKGTFVLTTHMLEEANSYCSRIGNFKSNQQQIVLVNKQLLIIYY